MKEKSRILKKANDDQSRPVAFNDSFGGGDNQLRFLLKHLPDKSFKDINLILNSTNHDLIEKEKIPKINFLSLDTQGSEYEILKGSIECLKKSIVAIKTEINFVEIYKNSKLFSDIDKLLCEHGFFLAELISFDNFYKERIPLEFRGKQIPLQGDALYFYNPDNIKLDNKINFVDKLEKLAFAFVVYGFTDLSFRSLNRIHLNKLNFKNISNDQKLKKQIFNKSYQNKEIVRETYLKTKDQIRKILNEGSNSLNNNIKL